MIRPGRNLVGLFGRMEVGIDSFFQLTSILRDHNIVILQVISSTLEGHDNEMNVLLFLDISSANIETNKLLEALNSSESFKVLEVIKPAAEGFIVDTVSSKILAGKSRVIILRDLGYSGLLTEIRKLFGTGGETLLHHVGFNIGMGLAKLHKDLADKIGIKDPVKIYQQISCLMFQWAGFGRVEVIELSPNHAIINVYNSFECERCRNSVRPYSQFVRGIIAGTLAELFNKGFNVVEDVCIAKGDPYCGFRANSRF